MKGLKEFVAVVGVIILVYLQHLSAANAVTPKSGEMNAHFINVGQGASVLLEFTCGAALVDTGGEKDDSFDSTKHLTDYLDGFFKRRTDLKSTLATVIISHPHIDHTRGLPTILSRYAVKSLIDNGQETGSGGRQQKAAHQKVRESHGAITYLAVTQRKSEVTEHRPTVPDGVLNCAQVAPEFTFLWGGLDRRDGWSNEILKNQNDSSVVTRLKFGTTTFLLPGDLEEDVQSDLIDQVCPDGPSKKCLLNVDILHVAHHGSHNGTTPEIVEAVTPKLAVISMGPFDRLEPWSAHQYGHPRDVAIKRLLDSTNGVSDTRSPVSEMIARRAASKATSESSAPQFTKMTINRAIYATGWPDDDNIVIAAKANSTWQVLSKAKP